MVASPVSPCVTIWATSFTDPRFAEMLPCAIDPCAIEPCAIEPAARSEAASG